MVRSKTVCIDHFHVLLMNWVALAWFVTCSCGDVSLHLPTCAVCDNANYLSEDSKHKKKKKKKTSLSKKILCCESVMSSQRQQAIPERRTWGGLWVLKASAQYKVIVVELNVLLLVWSLLTLWSSVSISSLQSSSAIWCEYEWGLHKHWSMGSGTSWWNPSLCSPPASFITHFSWWRS